MPYIIKGHRDHLATTNKPTSSGELNYLITQLCLSYLDSCKDQSGIMIPKDAKTNSYNDYNTVVGALECCKLEFVRRLVNPYEDIKIQENGDIY